MKAASMNQLTSPARFTAGEKPLHFLSVTEASRLIGAGTLSPVTLVEAFLARIAELDGTLRSYITVTAERARAAARVAEAEIAAGRWKGPLHGIPFAVKDNYYVAGIPTTGGSRLMLDHVSTTTSTAVARLEAAGAILLGKLNTWEYGTGNGGVYHDLPFAVARNPWDSGTLHRRLVNRGRRGGRGGDGDVRAGVGHRRLDPPSRRGLRSPGI